MPFDGNPRSHLQEGGMDSGSFPQKRALLSCGLVVIDVR
jgi:hypothetical protein